MEMEKEAITKVDDGNEISNAEKEKENEIIPTSSDSSDLDEDDLLDSFEKRKWTASEDELAIQKYLRTEGNTVQSLCKQFKLFHRKHKDFSNLLTFKYSSLRCNMREDIVKESRGIILDKVDNWKIISFPYKKFFNYNEKYAAKIDWESAKAFAKEDGSLATLYYYQGKWRVSSSGTPDASFTVFGAKLTFEDLFWEIFEKKNYMLPTDTDYCFMFELLSQRQKIVVFPAEDRLVFHGVRNLKTLKEEKLDLFAEKYHWETPSLFAFESLQKLVAYTNSLNPALHEGFVVVDKNFNRVKVKSRSYVALSFLSAKGKANNVKNMLQIVRLNESSEFLSYFPEWTNLYERVKVDFDVTLKIITEKHKEMLSKSTESDAINAEKYLSFAAESPFQKVFEYLLNNSAVPVRENFAAMDLDLLEETVSVATKNSSTKNEIFQPKKPKSLPAISDFLLDDIKEFPKLKPSPPPKWKTIPKSQPKKKTKKQNPPAKKSKTKVKKDRKLDAFIRMLQIQDQMKNK